MVVELVVYNVLHHFYSEEQMSTPVIRLGSFCLVMPFFMGELMSVQPRKESSNEPVHDKTNKTDMGA